MIKGFLFVIVLAIIYWAIYFMQTPSTPESSARKINATLLETTVEIFSTSENRNPETLAELVEKGYIESLPEDEGRPFKYNSATGEVK